MDRGWGIKDVCQSWLCHHRVQMSKTKPYIQKKSKFSYIEKNSDHPYLKLKFPIKKLDFQLFFNMIKSLQQFCFTILIICVWIQFLSLGSALTRKYHFQFHALIVYKNNRTKKNQSDSIQLKGGWGGGFLLLLFFPPVMKNYKILEWELL